uniref:DUF2489 domain-containing protein n=1 Tax=Panagrellus redivivus TaxID=6233 RepID=A0A7E4VWT7_PANRE
METLVLAFIGLLIFLFIFSIWAGLYISRYEEAKKRKAKATPPKRKESSYWLKLDEVEAMETKSIINGIQKLSTRASATGQNFNRVRAFEQGNGQLWEKAVVIFANNDPLRTTVVDEETPEQSQKITRLETLLHNFEGQIEALKTELLNIKHGPVIANRLDEVA